MMRLLSEEEQRAKALARWEGEGGGLGRDGENSPAGGTHARVRARDARRRRIDER